VFTAALPRSALATALALALSVCAAPVALAEDAPTSSQSAEQAPDPRQAEAEAAQQEAMRTRVVGPASVTLKDQATFALPKGYMWVPQPAAGRWMQAMGNHSSEALLGLVMPMASSDAHWMAVARWEAAGYIKDDDAKNWDVDELFQTLKDGTEAANKERKERGFDELEIVGWVEKPAYQAPTHRLVWSMAAHTKGQPAGEVNGINYNTYALGREGYITLNLLTDEAHVAGDKPHAATLLQALQFNEGKRYEDFNASTDKVAEYGLAALVGGIAAKKLGMFALAAGFFAKFAKVIALGALGVVAAARKLFGKKA
jgi:uncharacterized membrane-anchored protein